MDDDALPQDDAQMGHIEHFMLDMVGALQCFACANAASARQGLPLERLQAIGGKEFRGVRGSDLTRVEFWLESVVRILGQMGYFDEDKLGCAISLLTNEAHKCLWASSISRLEDGNLWTLFKNTEVFDKLIEKARALEETLGEEPKAASSRAIKRSTEATTGSGHKGKRGCFGRSRQSVYGGRRQDRAIVVHDQPITTAHVLTQGRGHGRGDGGKGVGQRGAARGGDGGLARVYAVREPRIRDVTDAIAGDSVVVDRAYRHFPLMVDCEAKLVTLCGASGLKVVVGGEKFELLFCVIYSLRAEKLVWKGCKAYLAYILNTDSREMRLDKIRVICDFPDVFPNELL
ncbi:putative alpha,alpha-trehalose-phosphate synthase [UDP-forming] 9 [Gossypium australe]|uniref:Putative alpha,alpha-trehalose-phosphate synthase [UDP-forming] 9 n=1 Tax=Gossypium australe TaxID=47621 RepID=A0A5B6VNR5_9ROSI|nr:putative alpha,alpha-trehalose-phosphate synthase [UDP-forming] 9 [Gossypium australe]